MSIPNIASGTDPRPLPVLEPVAHRDDLLDATPAAVVGVDRRGRTTVWNRGAQALFGWSAEDVLGRMPPIVPPTLRQEWRLQMRQVLEAGRESSAAETLRVTRDGRLVPVLRSAAPL